MRSSDLMVDGNALAGVLREIFVQEMTSARVKCGGSLADPYHAMRTPSEGTQPPRPPHMRAACGCVGS
jgi:Family of unknown function (DUF6510)